MERKAFETAVDKQTKAEGTIREAYQGLGIVALEHFKEHGNTHFMTYMFNALSDASPYKAKLSKWFRKYAPVRPTTDNKGQVFYKKTKKGHILETDVDGATEEKFWVVGGNAEDVLKAFNAVKLIENALKKDEKIAQDDVLEGYDKEKVATFTPAQREALKAFVKAGYDNMVVAH